MGRPDCILVTPRSVTKTGHPALQRLTSAGYRTIFCSPGVQPSEQELLQLVPGCVGYLAGVEPISAKVLMAADTLKVISRNGTGIDNIDLDAARQRGISICRAVGANARGVAELALGLMLALARSIPFSDSCIKRQTWERRTGTELESLTLGVVGCGHVGRLLSRFALALGMRVLAYDVKPDPDFTPGDAFRYATLDRLLSESDVISLHCPPTETGRPLLDGAALQQLKRGVYIINTARHELIDEAALAEAIAAGQVAGAAVDVFGHEPPEPSRLIESDRCIATPHIGGLTKQSVDRAMEMAVDNLLAALATGSGVQQIGAGA